MAGHYRVLWTPGQGRFAKVKLARQLLTGPQVSVTVIQRGQQSSSRHRGRVAEEDVAEARVPQSHPAVPSY